MEQYISKSALVAEIERRITDNKKDIERASHKNLEDYFEGYEDALALLKQQYLDTIETKDVNLDEDVDEIIKTAEDHAYFAGSENTREKLIDKACKWLKKWDVYRVCLEGRKDWFIEQFKKAMKE